MKCKIDQCPSPVRTAGYCQKHYLRVWRHGDPSISKLEKIFGSLRERYDARVVKTDGCWGWKGSKLVSGYGNIRYGGKIHCAHRLSYEFHIGPIPEGMNVCHKCDNPVCSNPDHLFIGTQQDNVIDMHSKKRWKSSKRTTRETVKSIRAAVATGLYTHSEIAEKFSVSLSTVGKILSGKTHKASQEAMDGQ